MHRVLYGIGALVVLLVIIGLALPRHARVEVSADSDGTARAAVARLERGHAVYLLDPLQVAGRPSGGLGDEGFEPPASSL